MKRKIIVFITAMATIFLLIPSVMAYTYNSDKVTVHVTVNDITDIDEPLNTIVQRQPLTVSNFDISQYGEEFADIPILDNGVTYLHVLIALHEQLYGNDKVAERLKLDSDGVTRIFMGRSVGSIMYKNGNYIFAVPQYVTVKEADEINICLYDEGYNQAIASFNEAYINVEAGDTVSLNLFMHHWYPELSEPIEGAQIVNENGVFVTDTSGNIIATDDNGDFEVTFPKTGVYKLTILPTVGYYMSQNGGTWVVWWEEVEVTEDVEKERINGVSIIHPAIDSTSSDASDSGYISPDAPVSVVSTTTALGKAVHALHDTSEVSKIDMVDWDNLPTIEQLGGSYFTITAGTYKNKYITEVTYSYETYTAQETHTELIKREEFVAGEASQKINYTTPWTIVNVTDEPVITEVKNLANTLYVTMLNTNKYIGNVICAAYDYDDDNNELYSAMVISELANKMTFKFKSAHDVYKIYTWGNSMIPLAKAYQYKDEPKIISWDFTQPLPANVIISGKE